MPTPILQLTAEDAKRRLNPLDEDGLFNYGAGTNIPEPLIDEICAEQEDVVISAAPEQYAMLARGEVEGEILCKETLGGETTLQLGLFPVLVGTVRLYVGYGHSTRPYSDRKVADRLSSDAYSVNTTTGLVTLATPLPSGQSVHADYEHTATYKAKLLRHVALMLVTAEIYETFPMFANEDGVVERTRTAAFARLEALYTDSGAASGVQLFDKLKLESETRRDERKALKMPLLGGM